MCPGCHAPVLSRHPKDKRFHFAHDTRHPDALPDAECPFSSIVALLMMVRHVLPDCAGKAFGLSPCSLMFYSSCCPKTSPQEIYVSTISSVVPTAIELNPLVGNMSFDAALVVGGHRIYVELFGGGRELFSINKPLLQNLKAGVISINVYELAALVSESLDANLKIRFSDVVLECLLKPDSKSWRFHPNEQSVGGLARAEHKCGVPIYRLPALRELALRQQLKVLHCLACLGEWAWFPSSYSGCPSCKTDRYVCDAPSPYQGDLL